jgi:hypothetical protein
VKIGEEGFWDKADAEYDRHADDPANRGDFEKKMRREPDGSEGYEVECADGSKEVVDSEELEAAGAIFDRLFPKLPTSNQLRADYCGEEPENYPRFPMRLDADGGL